MKISVLFSAIALLATTGITVSKAASPEVWFCPLDSMPRVGADYHGVPQYNDLFTPDSPWKNAAGHVTILKIYPDWIDHAPDADLKKQFADLKRRGIGLALEYGALTPGRAMEGYGAKPLLEVVKRIEDNGGDLKYIAMDEPLGLTLPFGSRPPVLTVQEAADNAAKNIKEMQAVYPQVKAGIIDGAGTAPIDAMLRNYKEGWEAFAKNGVPLAFYHADVDWQNPGALDDLRKIRDLAKQEGMSFGIIYDGNPQDRTDQAWLDSAKEHMAAAETAVGTPDTVIFQTWHPHPVKLLPETDPDAFTNIIDSYFRARTVLKGSLKDQTLKGTLTTKDGRAVPHAQITFTSESPTEEGTMGTFTATGTVPAGTETVCFGIRAHETGWTGTMNVKIADMKLVTQDGWTYDQNFTAPNGWANWGGYEMGDGGRVVGDKSLFCIIPRAGKRMLEVNGPAKAINAPNQTFTFTVQAQIPRSAVNAGVFGVFFLTSHGELLRKLINFQTSSTPVGTATTSTHGHWSLKLKDKPDAASQITARYAGDDKNWPAECVIPASAH